jgi:DNA-binding NarL/FixJ family response regulator
MLELLRLGSVNLGLESEVMPMTQFKPIRVLCVDDHSFLIEGLESCLNAAHGIEFTGSLPNPDLLCEEVTRLNIDVVLIDIEMPGLDPFAAVQAMMKQSPKTKAIFLSGHVLERYIDLAFEAGAFGYLSKNDPSGNIIDAIRRVHAGESVFGIQVLDRLSAPKINNRGRRDLSTPRMTRSRSLTPKQREILGLIGNGLSRAQIAKQLGCSAKTIDAHRHSIMEKTRMSDRTEMALYAIREGITVPMKVELASTVCSAPG